MKNNILALIAAVAGGAVGYFAFFWLVRQGLYGLILPGAFIGLAASHYKSRSFAVCVACGLLALVLTLVTEWQFAPFVKDDSFGFFLTHLRDKRPYTQIMIVLGAVMGFWFPFAHRNDDVKASSHDGTAIDTEKP